MPSLRTRNPAPTIVSDEVDLPPKFPELPEDVRKRFPSLDGWEEDTGAWWKRAYGALQSTNRWVSQTATAQTAATSDLRSQLGDFSAAISTEIDVITTEQEAQAKRIVTVSAMAGVSQNIKVQGTAPGSPVLNDYWIDNSDLLTPVTYQWDGMTWVEVTDPISAVAVADERTARVTADGFLSGNYTLTVVAGDVVTGMTITSSTGTGGTVSQVIFRADKFQIYNGTTGIAMFTTSGSDVNLAGTLVVSTSGKVYIGTGTYGNTNTAWYVDSAGQFSLKDKLTWNGTALTINGSITATTGTIGGWSLAATTLSANNAVLDSAGQLLLGTGNDLVVLSATDATYRIWIGNATAGSAAFRVTKAGVMTATGGSFSGSVTATSGSIGGFDIGADYIRDSANSFGLASTVTGGDDVRFWAGDTFANRAAAPFRVFESGAIFSSSGTIGGFTIGASDLTGSGVSLSPSAITVGVPSGSYLFTSIGAAGLSLYSSLPHTNSIAMTQNSIEFTRYSVGGSSLDGITLTLIDVNLYRSSANILKTDDSFEIGSDVGFYGTAATAKQTVTGSRGGNVALASLLTALATIGLLTDSSS